MYSIKKISIFLLLIFSINSYVYPQLIEKTNQLNKSCVTSFAMLKAGQKGKSPNGIPYQMYGLKDGNDWILVVADTSTLYSFRKTPKIDTLIPNSAFFDINLCQLVQQKSADLKLKEKEIKIGDVVLNAYYSFNSRSTRKFFNAFNEVETGTKKLTLLEKLIAPITNLFKLKPPKIDTKILQEVANLKKQLETQTKALEDLKKENDKLKEAAAKANSNVSKKEEVLPQDSLAKKEKIPQDSLINIEKNKKQDTKKTEPKNVKHNSKDKKEPKKNEARITSVTNATKKKLPVFKSTGKPTEDSLRHEIELVIYQIDLRKEIQKLQYEKVELRQKSKDLAGNAPVQKFEPPTKEKRIKETMKMMEEMDMIMIRLEKESIKKEFVKKKEYILKKRQELADELNVLQSQ